MYFYTGAYTEIGLGGGEIIFFTKWVKHITEIFIFGKAYFDILFSFSPFFPFFFFPLFSSSPLKFWGPLNLRGQLSPFAPSPPPEYAHVFLDTKFTI